jgi:hypothetical protein
VSDDGADDDRPRALSRYAVRFVGGPVTAARAALEARGIPSISAGAVWPSSSSGLSFEDHSAVGVHATSKGHAIRKVRDALEGHGDFSDFEAMPIGDSPDADDA